MTTYQASFASQDRIEEVQRNLQLIEERIKSTGRTVDSVRIVGVTKTFGPDAIEAAYLCGLSVVGENYVDELHEKRALLPALPVSWHYLGALQSRKIKMALESASVLCGVARQKEIEKIAAETTSVPIYIQIDFTNAPQRNGAPAAEIEGLVTSARKLGLNVQGLMTVPNPEPLATAQAFRELVKIADDLAIPERSMGMSEDLEMACELGSTEIRIGRALFGAREYKSAT